MAINFEKAFGLHPLGIELRAKRAEIIASNIANADTPGYKAKGLDFQKALEQASQQQKSHNPIKRTHEKHFELSTSTGGNVEFRVPNQPDTGDGNTVDVQVEQNLYLQNSIEYQASLQFLTGKIKGMKKAITGVVS